MRYIRDHILYKNTNVVAYIIFARDVTILLLFFKNIYFFFFFMYSKHLFFLNTYS